MKVVEQFKRRILDLSFFQNSLTMGVEYFNKKTSDMLLTVPTVPSAGLSSDPMTNAGSVRNYGVEGNVSYKRRFGKFSFDIGFNLSWIKNEVTSLGTGNEPIWGAFISESSIIDFVTKTEVGRPIGSFYGYVTDGIFQNYDEIKASAQYDWGKRDGEQTTRPGDFRFKDLNGDGQITSEDRTFLGSPLPDLVFGIPLQFSYGDFDLNIFFQGQTGNEIFNVMDYYLYNGAAGNVYADIRSQHWSGQIDPNRAFFPLNTEATIPDLDGDDAARNFRASDFLVQDGVLVDGTVVPCCLDHNGDMNLGNLFEHSLEQILQSPRAQAIYEGFTHHSAAEPLCQRCGYSAVSKRFRK